jgi:hypothetical protein
MVKRSATDEDTSSCGDDTDIEGELLKKRKIVGEHVRTICVHHEGWENQGLCKGDPEPRNSLRLARGNLKFIR